MDQPEVEGTRRFPAEVIEAQIRACLLAWGMSEDHAATAAHVMVDADVYAIDSHGISSLTSYALRRNDNSVTFPAKVGIVKETPVSVLIDAGGGLGYVPAMMATRMVIDKAKRVGLATAAVRNSNHFGATGYFSRLMAAEGLVGLVTTNCSTPRSAPTLGKDAKLSTNPLAFAAPGRRNPMFHLDMATTTVAAGKVRNKDNEGLPLPLGWANEWDGTPMLDAHHYGPKGEGGTLTPLGGTEDGASYKGYGLGAMVEILSAGLSGADLVTAPDHGYQTPGTMDLGHFFLAIDPTVLREPGGLEETVDDLVDHLHATEPVDPSRPVMVAGEPQDQTRAERERLGIPVPPGLRAKLRELSEKPDTPFEFLLLG